MDKLPMEAHQKTSSEPETANLSGNPEPGVESGKKPDEADVKKPSQSTAIHQTGNTNQSGKENGRHRPPKSLN